MKKPPRKERITLDMSEGQMLKVMCEGNPGAMNVLLAIQKEGERIDPQSFGWIGALLSLDTLGIYGSSIWMLYKDVCRENLSKMLAVLRSHQMGITSTDTLLHAINNRGQGIDVKEACAKVQSKLSAFVIDP